MLTLAFCAKWELAGRPGVGSLLTFSFKTCSVISAAEVKISENAQLLMFFLA